VVKVESTKRPDPARRGFLADYGGTNRSPNFNELNLNKRSFQVDLSQPAGLALAHRLAGWADVVVDNFRPGVMARFGLDAERLLAERPELIVVSSSANGATGPDATAAGLASIFGATGGLSEQTGYADGPPTEIGEWTDYRSGAALAVAVLAALLTARTGTANHRPGIARGGRSRFAGGLPLSSNRPGPPWERHRDFPPTCTPPGTTSGSRRSVTTTSGGLAARPTRDQHYGRSAPRTPASSTTRSRHGRCPNAREATRRPPACLRWRCSRTRIAAAACRGGVFVDVEPEIGRTRGCAPWLFSDLECVRPGPLIGTSYVLDAPRTVP
jgi:hypothetical protein